jgi:hypothetical protein
MKDASNLLPYAGSILSLLKGIVYEDDNKDTWNNLIQYNEKITNYFANIGIDLFVYESEGYAFLKQTVFDEGVKVPQLIEKRALSFPVTLLLVLLREKIFEWDNSMEGSSRLILSKTQIKDLLMPFISFGTNEVKAIDKIDPHINKLIDYGFLRKLKDDPNKLEVKRIIKSKITAEELNELKNKLETHARTTGLFD